MKKIIISLLLLGCLSPGFGQSYNTAIGMRIGTEWGLTLRQRIYRKISAEVLLQSSLQRNEVDLTFLTLFHQPILTRRLNLYGGFGVHRGWVPTRTDGTKPYKDPYGIDFMGGLELTIGRVNVSYDFKPAINISGGEHTFYSQTGISLRYVLWKHDRYFYEQRNRRRGLFHRSR
jgi:hypothetical protein